MLRMHQLTWPRIRLPRGHERLWACSELSENAIKVNCDVSCTQPVSDGFRASHVRADTSSKEFFCCCRDVLAASGLV